MSEHFHNKIVNIRDQKGRTPIFLACGIPSSNLRTTAFNPRWTRYPVSLLLEAGASVNAVDDTGETPLHRACSSLDGASIRSLVLRGADPTLPSHGKNGVLCFELAPQGADRDGVLSRLGAALRRAGRFNDFRAMLARSAARDFVNELVSHFDALCDVCYRRISVCEENRQSRFPYWIYHHGLRRCGKRQAIVLQND